MKVVVTGALGHIGSRLIRELPLCFPSAEIVIVDNLSTQRYPSLFSLPKEGCYKFVEADVTNIDLQPIFRGADVVIHLAALTDATSSFDNKDAVERINFTATKCVAEACVSNGINLIHASSTSVYGSQSEMVDETCSAEELQPQSPYAETKLKEEVLIAKMCRSNGLKAITFRFGTIFGTSPGMRFHTAVNKFCWQSVMGQPLTVWKTAYDQKRPYLDLSDAVRAVEFVIKKGLFTGLIYNVVSTNITVREVVETIRAYVPSLEINFVENQIMNQLSYEVMNTRIVNAGFDVRGNIEKGIVSTIDLLKNSNNYAELP